jgi:hypothetical protein
VLLSEREHELPGEIEEISSTSLRLTLSREVPVGSAVKIDDGERILLAEVVRAESVGQEHTLQLHIEHSFTTNPLPIGSG